MSIYLVLQYLHNPLIGFRIEVYTTCNRDLNLKAYTLIYRHEKIKINVASTLCMSMKYEKRNHRKK